MWHLAAEKLSCELMLYSTTDRNFIFMFTVLKCTEVVKPGIIFTPMLLKQLPHFPKDMNSNIIIKKYGNKFTTSFILVETTDQSLTLTAICCTVALGGV